MKIKVTQWSINTLKNRFDSINDQPEYQRGQVWSRSKQALLNESIFRGIDLPKIYLRKLVNKHHEYEVADGQQRICSIKGFLNNKINLPKGQIGNLTLSRIGSTDLSGKYFDNLDDSLKNFYYDTKLTISIIEDASEEEIRVLFGRLQEGVTLNAAEKRNAIVSVIGKHIESIALNHKFFESSKINSSRFKHIDYLAHAFGLIIYQNKFDLKSDLLEKMYLNSTFTISHKILQRTTNVLDLLWEIDMHSNKNIVNKFTFIDLFWFFYNNDISKIDLNRFILRLLEFEELRLYYRKRQEDIIKDKKLSKVDKSNLIKYIVAYDRSGSIRENIEIRHEIFTQNFKEYL